MKDKKRLLLVVPDSTRKAHLDKILPHLLRILTGSCKVDIVAATGLHKPHSGKELEELVGHSVFARVNRVYSHNYAKSNLASFGVTKSGIPICLNKNLKRYDGIISIGVIEPHLYAGYSGGAKTIAIGLAGEDIINRTHHPSFLDRQGVSIGSIRRNAFQRTLWEIVKPIPYIFSINVINDSSGRAVKLFFGKPKEVFEKGAAFARRIYEKEVKGRADVVIANVACPKDINLYQASRAINYIADSRPSILKDGGFLVVSARLRDGLGSGLAEKRCFEALRRKKCLKEFVEDIKSKGCRGGEHRAYMIARAMLRVRVIIAGQGAPEITRGLPFIAFRGVEEAMRYIRRESPNKPKIYVVPDAFSIIAKAA